MACAQKRAKFGVRQNARHNLRGSYERRVRNLFQHLPIKLDVKNEARVHLWYEDRFGYAIKPYSSSADAIATFPTTATAVGVRQIHSKFECCAPFGLTICLASLSDRINGR